MTNDFSKAREDYIECKQRTSEAQRIEGAARKRLRELCEHKLVAERDYISSASGLFDTIPPKRVCETCGIQEEGWGVGYKILKNSEKRIVKEVSDDAFGEISRSYPTEKSKLLQ